MTDSISTDFDHGRQHAFLHVVIYLIMDIHNIRIGRWEKDDVLLGTLISKIQLFSDLAFRDVSSQNKTFLDAIISDLKIFSLDGFLDPHQSEIVDSLISFYENQLSNVEVLDHA